MPRDCVYSQCRVLGARWVLVPSLHVFLLEPQFFKEKMKEEILVIYS